MATDYHAEHVGSLLRPPWLLEARGACEKGAITSGSARLHGRRGPPRVLAGRPDGVSRRCGPRAADRFLLEYDSERAGGFEPLRFVPRGTTGPTVVLGLVTTKIPHLESRDELCRRIDEAARYVPLEQLAISPQCGFASGSLWQPDHRRR